MKMWIVGGACAFLGLVVGVLGGWLALTQARPESNAKPPTQQDTDATAAAYKGKSAGVWAQQLQDKNLDNRLEAAHALQEIGSGVKPHTFSIETAIKSASWDILLLIGETASESSVFSTISLLPQRSSYATEQQYQKAVLEYNQYLKKSEELIKERQEKRRQLELKVAKHVAFIAALVKVLEKADPERLSSMGVPPAKAQQFFDWITRKPQEHTFTSVPNTIGSSPQGGSFGQVQPNKLSNPKK
jgi:hypothetical protein